MLDLYVVLFMIDNSLKAIEINFLVTAAYGHIYFRTRCTLFFAFLQKHGTCKGATMVVQITSNFNCTSNSATMRGISIFKR